MEKYIELIEYSISNRNTIINVTDYKNERRNYEAYTSMFMYEAEVIDYIKNNVSPKTGKNSIEGYIGNCSASYLWIDVDIEGDIKGATEKMIDIVNKIENKYGITYRSLSIYFSGMKGYHVGIPVKSFGATDYSSPILPKIFKTMARAIVDNTSGVDFVIYNTSRIFRCPLSMHPKTSMYKISVDFPSLREGKIDEMMKLAYTCSRHCTYSLLIEFSDNLKKLFDDTIQNEIANVDVYEDEDGYQTAISLQSNSSIFRLPKKGERNDLIYRMAYRLFSMKELKVNEVSDLLKFIYEITNEHSIKQGWSRYSEMELRISINSAYSRTRLKSVSSMKATDFASMVIGMFKAIKEAQYIPTFLSDISTDLKGGWKIGNLYCLIGKGGTMKSYLLQEEIIRTAMELKKPAMFFNLEMSQVDWYDRVWTALFGASMTEMMLSGYITEDNIEAKALEVKGKIESNLHFFSEVDIEPEDIENIVRSKQDEIKKKLHLCGIDSVGGMKLYNDSEGMNAMKTSKYLKEAAKKLNTVILLINHARNDCPATMRDCSSYIRGGSKFIDNCDAYLSLSSVIDKENSNLDKQPQDIVYKTGIKYLRFVNKRGSGNTINKIIQFGSNGRVITTDDNPADMEVSLTGDFSY